MEKNNFLLIVPFILIISIGLIMISSSSIYIAQNLTGNPFYFSSKQFLFFSIGLMSMIIFLKIPSDFLFKTDWLFLLISIILLITLLIPGLGTEVNGSIRWIDIGPFNIQPSEICKFSLILYISGYCVRRLSDINKLRSFLKPLLLLSAISLLILSQPDLGSTAIICALVVGILFFAGISFSQFLMLIILLIFLGYAAITSSPMRISRMMAFQDPFAIEVVQSSGLQLANSLISIGQGGWFGLGLGNSFQKNFFLPEAHTDFIFAILVEELGIIGGIVLIVLYSLLFFAILRISIISYKKKRLFQSFVCFGIFILLSAQTIFNLGVNVGLLPTKGLTLPFVSYGGTSLIIMMSLVAIVLRINNENKFL